MWHLALCARIPNGIQTVGKLNKVEVLGRSFPLFPKHLDEALSIALITRCPHYRPALLPQPLRKHPEFVGQGIAGAGGMPWEVYVAEKRRFQLRCQSRILWCVAWS